jgi:hypothetical protein
MYPRYRIESRLAINQHFIKIEKMETDRVYLNIIDGIKHIPHIGE